MIEKHEIFSGALERLVSRVREGMAIQHYDGR
jgi:hypothetical protein